ncbi:hypothetical protein [Humisphaera borealis]|uniref:Uncharacterized protein n=1 Tax=Humisphaera borealis TaxID=2807512 RepID=A0A7M2X1Q3_9BACT|nr:hypothetical protein [Humisphaera borealis]QOV91687.1 hypothetical protein IPV69_10115 [Humisphaera borealis]
MRSWLRNLCAARTAQAAAVASQSLLDQARLNVARPFVACERLEDRQLLSGSPDVTYTYGGKIKIVSGSLKAKEAITISLTSQTDTGYITGQISSLHTGTVDVKGYLEGNKLTLVGATSGRLVEGTINKKGLKFAGTVVNGIDKSTGTFKVKAIGDAPGSLQPASRAGGTASLGGSSTPSSTPTGSVPVGSLDPNIDPATGLPRTSSGTVIDPSKTTPTTPTTGTSAPTGAGSGASAIPLATPSATPLANVPLAPGNLIGTNYSILGVWTGQFNFDSSGKIENITTGATTGAAVNGTRPGVDPRTATFSTTSQDLTGLVTGTLTVAELGTYVYTGFVNGTNINLVLSGPGPGLVTATLNTTFDTFTGTLTNAEANGFRANGPINATFFSGGGSGVVLPAGEELFHVNQTNTIGDPTVGNLDPNGASLGMDFSVGTIPLVVNSLGAFDDNADGLQRTIRVAIYNITTPTIPVVVSDITTFTSELAPNSNFRYLTTFTPITLTTGVYRIVAFGYGAGELAGDTGVGTYTGPIASANTGNNGQTVVYPITNGLNANNWRSATGNNTNLVFPTLADGLPLNRYLAGSFLFEEGTPIVPPVVPPVVPPPPTTITKPANTAFPGGVKTTPTGPEVFGDQSGAIIP